MPEAATVVGIPIERNGIKLLFNPTEITRGKEKGSKFPFPATEDVAQLTGFIGVDTVKDILLAKVRQLCQAWNGEALESSTDKSDGSVNQETYLQEFVKMVQLWSSRGESIATLKNRLIELAETLGTLDLSGANIEHLRQAQAIGKNIAAIKQDMKDKKRKTAEDLAAEAETAAA